MAGRPGAESMPNRSVLARLCKLMTWLKPDRPMTIAGLAERLAVSERSVKRDIRMLRDRFDQPIFWDRDQRSYVLRRGGPEWRVPQEAPQAVVLGGVPLGRALRKAEAVFGEGFGDRISLPFAAEPAGVVQVEAALAPLSEDMLARIAVLFSAICGCQEVRFHYRKAKAGAVEEVRRIRPLHLGWCDGEWMLTGLDQDRRALRHYVVARLSRATAATTTFQRPEGWTSAGYFAGSLGRFVGTGDYRVRVRLHPDLAAYVTVHPWHKSQLLETTPDAQGWVVLTLRLNTLEDLRRRLLGHGGQMEVLEPRELRAEIAAIGAQLVEAHRPREAG